MWILLVLLALSFCELKAEEKIDRLVSAVCMVESGGNDFVIGDKHLKEPAYGRLQIREPVCRDVNRRFGTSYRAIECLGNQARSVEIFKKYLSIYMAEFSYEKGARLWNGGPKGPWKNSTLAYWAKVKKELIRRQ